MQSNRFLVVSLEEIRKMLHTTYREILAAIPSVPRFARWVVLVTLLMGPGFSAFGQITTVTADQAPPVQGAGHDYIRLMNETVSPAAGAVNIQIDALVPNGREIGVPFAFAYDSNSARHFVDGSPVIHDNGGYLAQGGWRYVVPQLQELLIPAQITGDQSGSATLEIELGLWPAAVPAPGMSIVGGFAEGINGTYCNAFNSYTFTGATGTLYPLGINIGSSRFQGCTTLGSPSDLVQNTNGSMTATTSSTAQLNIGNNPAPAAVKVSDHDGTVYSFSNVNGRLHNSGAYFTTNTTHDGTTVSTIPFGINNYESSLPDFVESRNGNQIQFADDDAAFSSSGAFHITDTLGRKAVAVSSFGNPAGDTVAVSGFSQPYKLSWGTASYNWSYNAQIIASTLQPAPYFGCAIPVGNNTSTVRGPNGSSTSAHGTIIGSSPVVTALTLPNGLSYQFLYDNPNNDNPYGLLREIIYPNGAYVRYAWGLNSQSTSVLYPPTLIGTAPGAPPIGWSCEALEDVPAIQKRFVSFDGTHEVQEQDFQYTTTWAATQNPSGSVFQAWSQKTTTVTTYDKVANTSSITVYTYVPQADQVLGNDPQGAVSAATGVIQAHPVEAKIQYKDGSGHVLRTVNKQYGAEYLPPTGILTTLENGQSSYVRTQFRTDAFQSAIDVISDIFEYDFGLLSDAAAPGPHGALIRHTHADYNHAFPLNPLLPAISSSTPFNTGIVDRPSDVITYDGNGNRMSELTIATMAIPARLRAVPAAR